MRLLLSADPGAEAGPFALEDGNLELGRDEACQVRLGPEATQVSRRHATITREGDAFVLVDRSRNGTFVNGAAVASTRLRHGDTIELGWGGTRLVVAIEAAPPLVEQPTQVSAATAALPRPPLAESGFFDPERDKGRRPGHANGVVVLLMILAGSFLGLLTALLLVFQMGLGVALVGLAVAFGPAPVYLAVWLWLDRYDPEPAWVLAGAFIWGAGAATFVAGLINSLFQATMVAVTSDMAVAELLSASISAPFGEELLKGVAVLAVFLFFRHEFDGVLDGIVYAGVVALGFAAVENVLYYGRALATKGPGLLVVVFVLRGVLGPFSHAVFTSMIGIGCGLARESHRRGARLVMPVLGYLAAVTLHGLWNTLAAVSGGLAGYLVIYAVVWGPLFLGFFAVVIYMGHREAQLIRRMLEFEVARGLLRPEHVRLASSWLGKTRWLLSDLGRFGVRRQFLHATARLAMCYWHASRAAAAGGQTISVSQVPVFQAEVRTLLPLI